MAKKTLLELTQSILNDMDSDEINSINDTVESTQVVQIIQDTYDEITSSRTWPHLNRLIQLTPQGAARPTHMDTDPTWIYLNIVKYNVLKLTDTRDRYVDIFYVDPSEFLDITNARNSSATDTDTITDPSGVDLYIFNDTKPQWYTTFDDEVLVFDAYDSEVDANLQQSKFQCFGNVEAAWTSTNLFVPDLPAKAFSYLLSEAKSTAFNALRQVGNQKEEQKSRRQRVHLAREKWRIDGGMKFPDYGRSSAKTTRTRSTRWANQ